MVDRNENQYSEKKKKNFFCNGADFVHRARATQNEVGVRELEDAGQAECLYLKVGDQLGDCESCLVSYSTMS